MAEGSKGNSQQKRVAAQEKASAAKQGGGADKAAGQQKQVMIENPETGEQRSVTQQEWRTQGKALRQAGFVRPDDEEAEAATDTTEAPSAEGTAADTGAAEATTEEQGGQTA